MRAALVARAEELLQVALWCVSEAQDTLDDGGGWARITEARHAIERAEALHAGILNRCGVSWDVMASRADQTRQALHRRLAKRADDLVRQAVEFEDLHMVDIAEHADALVEVLGAQYLEELAESEEYFGEAAKVLTVLRRRPRWWEWWRYL